MADFLLTMSETRFQELDQMVFVGKRWLNACFALALSSFALMSQGAIAAEYPTQTVRIINPFAAGGSLDVTGRLIAQQLQEKWAKPVVVENRPGGSTAIGISAVAHSPPNGYTLGLATNLFAMNAARMKNLPYDSRKDIAAISILVETPFMLVARADFPAKTIDELIKYARENPGKLNYGSIGNGSSPHVAGELLKRAAGIEMVHVPYKGAAPALQDLIGGTISIMFANVPDVVPYLEAGTFTALATTGKTRSSRYPQIPTMSEVGYPEMSITSWYALVAPSGTPQELIDSIARDVAEAIMTPAVRENLSKLELTPIASTPGRLKELLDTEFDRYEKITAELGLEQMN